MESAPRRNQNESASSENIFDRNHYIHMREEVAVEIARSNGLEVKIVRRDGIYLGEPIGHDAKRLQLSVFNGIIAGAKFG